MSRYVEMYEVFSVQIYISMTYIIVVPYLGSVTAATRGRQRSRLTGDVRSGRAEADHAPRTGPALSSHIASVTTGGGQNRLRQASYRSYQ